MNRNLVAFSIVALGSLALTAPASADAAKGEVVFHRCQACHSMEEGKNKVGPSLHGVVGRKAASLEGYNYSDALKKANLTWDEATLTKWLQNPRKLVPGTKMVFPGLRSEDDIKNVIDYIKQASK